MRKTITAVREAVPVLGVGAERSRGDEAIRRTVKLLSVITAATLLCSCASYYDHENRQVLNSWIGATREKLEASWGPPNYGSSLMANGTTMLVYERGVGFRYSNDVCRINYYVSPSDRIVSWDISYLDPERTACLNIDY